jgi:hypothetical protein
MSEKNVDIIKDDAEDTRPLDITEDEAYGPAPTAEDWKNMREIADSVPRSAYLVIAIEFCERFTYYGLGGPFQNYIQNPAPDSCKTYAQVYVSIFMILIACAFSF